MKKLTVEEIVTILKDYVPKKVHSDLLYKQNLINNEIVNKEEGLTEDYFQKGVKKKESSPDYFRGNKYYTSLYDYPMHEFTNNFLYQCKKRDIYFNTVKKDLYEKKIDRQKHPYIEYLIKYQKVERVNISDNYLDYNNYESLLVDQNFTEPVIDELEQNAILLKINPNLPHHETLEYVKNFLDQMKQNNIKKPREKQYNAKLQKLVDMFFIYDGLKLKLSQESIRFSINSYRDETSNFFEAEIGQNTFSTYKNKIIELIDDKGYLDIANGKKKFYDFIP